MSQAPSGSCPRELMILVERVVRPLPIPLARRKRLRTEFLLHLQAIYAEELTRANDHETALARTRERFGDPADLSRELRGTVRWWERWLSRYERSVTPRRDEPAWRFALRPTSQFACALSVMMALVAIDHHVFGVESFSWLQFRLMVASVVFLIVWLGGFLLCGLYLGAEWEEPHPRWRRVTLLSLTLISTFPLSLFVLMILAGGSWTDYAMPYMASFIGGGVSVICGTTVGVLHQREMRYHREWADLDLETL